MDYAKAHEICNNNIRTYNVYIAYYLYQLDEKLYSYYLSPALPITWDSHHPKALNFKMGHTQLINYNLTNENFYIDFQILYYYVYVYRIT